MGLNVPDLDDTDYESLLESARQLIPAYSEEWTDYNPQDPGIATLELLAWVTETYTYQLDQVTDDHREKYLGLLGDGPRPPRAATTELSVTVPEGAAGEEIPVGERLSVVDGSGEHKTFETTAPVTLVEAAVAAVVTEHPSGTTDNTDANDTPGTVYRPFGGDSARGTAAYVGFEGDPFGAADRLSVTVDYHDDDLPPTGSHGDEAPFLEPSVELAWEYCTDYANYRDDAAWEPLPVVEDGTNALYWGGRIAFERPDGWAPAGAEEATVLGHGPGLHWIRCRVERGGYEVPPRLETLALNVVPVEHRATVRGERLERIPGTPEGLNGQTFRFEHSPVLEATVTVDGEPWTVVEDFDASGPTDHHIVIDHGEGVVRFGDGRSGAVPSPDADVVAERYVHGGGDEGNVPADATWRFDDETTTLGGDTPLSAVDLVARRPARGGADAESIAAALRRVRRDLATRYRAVTGEDLAAVARLTPGCRFGRTTVRREAATNASRAGTDGGPDPTASRVVVVPYAPPDAPRPDPSEGFLDAVDRHLDRHRLLGDRVSVEGPTYVGVELTVDLAVASERELPTPVVEERIRTAVEEYVDPLRGFDGDGWPFGRTLYLAELEAVVAELEWVRESPAVTAFPGAGGSLDDEGNVVVGSAALLAVDDVSVSVERRRPRTSDDREGHGDGWGGADGPGLGRGAGGRGGGRR